MRFARCILPVVLLVASVARPAHAQRATTGIWVKIPPGPTRAAFPALRDGRTCVDVAANATRTCTFAVDSGFRFEIRLVGTGAATFELKKYERDLTNFSVAFTSRTSNCLQVRPRYDTGPPVDGHRIPMEPAYLSIRTATPYKTLAQCTAERGGPRG